MNRLESVGIYFTKDTIEKLESDEAQAVLECLALSMVTDIAPVEAKHAWHPSLQTLTAKFVSGTVGRFTCFAQKAFSLVKKEGGTVEDTCHQANRKTSQSIPKQKKSGGGGAYRAFCSYHSKGKFSAETLHELGKAYRGLSPEDKAYWQSVGEAATRAHKAGFKAFGTNARAHSGAPDLLDCHSALSERPADIPLPGTETSTGAIIAADSSWELQMAHMYFGTDSFSLQYQKVKDIATEERRKHLQELELSKEEEKQLLIYEGSAMEEDFVQQLAEHQETAGSFLRVASRLKSLLCLEWFVPVAYGVKA